MPGDEDIRLTARRIEELGAGIHEADLTIDEALRIGTEVLERFREFRRQCSSARFEVLLLEGGTARRPFDWRSIKP